MAQTPLGTKEALGYPSRITSESFEVIPLHSLVMYITNGNALTGPPQSTRYPFGLLGIGDTNIQINKHLPLKLRLNPRYPL